MAIVVPFDRVKKSKVSCAISLGTTPGMEEIRLNDVICFRHGHEFFLTRRTGEEELIGSFPQASSEWKYGPYGLVFTSSKYYFFLVRPHSFVAEHIGGYEHDEFRLDRRGVVFRVGLVWHLIALGP